MSGGSDLDESSVVEYSLAELAFIILFVILLLSSWDINVNTANLQEKEKNLEELQRQLDTEVKENRTLKEAIAWLPTDETNLPDMLMLVDKREYLALQATADDAKRVVEKIAPVLKDVQPSLLAAITDIASSTELLPDDPIIVSKGVQQRLEDELDNLRAQHTLTTANDEEDLQSDDPAGVAKVGTIGFCTYELPAQGSKKVYGSSVALGTLLVEEDGVTLIAKNSAIQLSNFVDIAGEHYNTSFVSDEIEKWPMGQKLSPAEFQRLGAKFVAIGDMPSTKRVECRFGMDYFLPVYSKKSFSMLKDVVESSFYKHTRVSEGNFSQLFPEYDSFIKNGSDPLSLEGQGPNLIDMIGSSQEKLNNHELAIAKNSPVIRESMAVLSRATPSYPSRAERRGIKGFVEIVYKVSAQGNAKDIEILREEPQDFGFAEASVDALKKYRFKPETEDGNPIISGPHNIRFRF